MNTSITKHRNALIALLMILLNGAGASASTPWEVNPGDYRYDMSIYLDVFFPTGKMDYSLYEVAAFHGEECRGIAEILPTGEDSDCLYLRARSNEENGEELTFSYRDIVTGEVQPIGGVEFEFRSNSRLGYPSDPYKVEIARAYTLTLYLNDELYSTEEVEFGSPLDIGTPEVPVGMTFSGWEEVVPATMPAHDVVLHGKYSKVTGTTVIDIDGNVNVTVEADMLRIRGVAARDIELVEIFDTDGRKILHVTNVAESGIRLPKLSTGIYVVVVKSNSEFTYHKISIN